MRASMTEAERRATTLLPPPMPATEPVKIKTCRCCGASYDAVQWDELRYGGVMFGELELRDCATAGCGNTLSLRVADLLVWRLAS